MKHYLPYNQVRRKVLEEIGLEPGMPGIQADLKTDGTKWAIQILRPRKKQAAEVAYGVVKQFLDGNYLESLEGEKVRELLTNNRSIVAKIAMSPYPKNCFILKFDPNISNLRKRREFYRDALYEINESIKDFGEIVGEHIIKEADGYVVVFEDYKDGLKGPEDFKQAGVTMADMEKLEDKVAGLLNVLFSTSFSLKECSESEICDYSNLRKEMWKGLGPKIERVLNQKGFDWLRSNLKNTTKSFYGRLNKMIAQADGDVEVAYKWLKEGWGDEEFAKFGACHMMDDFVHCDLSIPYNAFPPKEFFTDNKAKLAIIDVDWGRRVPSQSVRPIIVDYTKAGVSLLDLENEIFNFKETSDIDSHIARIDKKFFSSRLFISTKDYFYTLDRINPFRRRIRKLFSSPSLVSKNKYHSHILSMYPIAEFDFYKVAAIFSEVVHCKNKKERLFWNRFTKLLFKKMVGESELLRDFGMSLEGLRFRYEDGLVNRIIRDHEAEKITKTYIQKCQSLRNVLS